MKILRMKRYSLFRLHAILFLVHLSSAIVWEADDAWIIDDQVDDAEETTNEPIIAGENNTCISSAGVSGYCQTMKECYPYLFRYDNATKQWIQSNGALVSSYLEGSDECNPNGYSERDSSEKRGMEDQYVCCTPVLYTRGKPWVPPTDYASDLESEVSLSPEGASSGEPAQRVSTSGVNQACGSFPFHHTVAVVGGRPARIGEFPFAVAIINKNQQMCGGSLINNRYVLSAAHCLNRFKKHTVQNLRVFIGDHDYTKPGEAAHVVSSVVRIKYHKQYNERNLENDVALLELPSPIKFATNIQPVCLHTGQSRYDSGQYFADVAGWGGLYHMGPLSPFLKTANLRIITNQQCANSYAGTQGFPITANMVCATSDDHTGVKKDSCQGDSGGPLTVVTGSKAQQVGIVSWGIGCGERPGVYTRVDKYLKWIKKWAT